MLFGDKKALIRARTVTRVKKIRNQNMEYISGCGFYVLV